jgi:hypothetical protein
LVTIDSGQTPPREIVALADARAVARAEKNWPEADRLRGELETAGWKVVDAGFSYRLEPARPPTLEADGVVRYGASADVPSRLDDTPIGLASIVIVATDWPADLERTLTSITEHGPDGCQIVLVGDGPSAEQEATLLALDAADPGGPGIETDVVLTSERLGYGAALNAALRRAAAAAIVVLDSSLELVGDAITPLVRALDDRTTAVVGPFGIVTDDLRHFRDAPSGDVDAIEGYCLAFRRADFAERGPLDERFRFYRNLDIWWSLVLRDEGPRRRPRRAVALDEMPVVRHEHRGWAAVDEDERNRLSKRNFYRILDRFGDRLDLITG